MIKKTYEDGLQDGRIEGLREILSDHDDRLTDHAKRLVMLERLFWGGVGILAFVKVWPDLQVFFGGGG